MQADADHVLFSRLKGTLLSLIGCRRYCDLIVSILINGTLALASVKLSREFRCEKKNVDQAKSTSPICKCPSLDQCRSSLSGWRPQSIER